MFNPKLIALRTALKVLQGSGLTGLLRGRLQGIGSIFCLHQVCPGGGLEEGFAPNSKIEVTPEFLRELIGLVRERGFETVSLARMAERLKTGQASDKPMAVFTLDDGYKDNFIHAKPVFEELNCPYTIFVAPAIADGTCNLWWRTLEQIVGATDHLRVTLAGRDFDLTCRTVRQKDEAFTKLFLFLYFIDQHEQRRLVDALALTHGIDPMAYCAGVAMGWDELREIAKSPLCTIGAHTINHFGLAMLSPEDARAEIKDSKTRLESELGQTVEFLAYPYGDPPTVGSREFVMAQEAGFVASVTTRKGVIWPQDVKHMQSLPRIMISGRYQERVLVDALISGLPTALLNKFSPIHLD